MCEGLGYTPSSWMSMHYEIHVCDQDQLVPALSSFLPVLLVLTQGIFTGIGLTCNTFLTKEKFL